MGFKKNGQSRVDVQHAARPGVSAAPDDSEHVQQQQALFDA